MYATSCGIVDIISGKIVSKADWDKRIQGHYSPDLDILYLKSSALGYSFQLR